MEHNNNNKNVKVQTATLAGGCFWCIEAMFLQLKGVTAVESGYCGGRDSTTTYEQVKTGTTGHAEVINITFNPEQIDFYSLLGIFFKIHDPTTLNRQGADVGTQYRSAIFYHNEQQKDDAIKAITKLNEAGIYETEIVTTVEEYSNYTKAEDYHQNYYEQNKNENQYCGLVITPKMEKFKKVFSDLIK